MKTLLFALFFTSINSLAQQPVSPTSATGVKGIHHVSISVRDIDRAVAYYKSVMGLTEVRRYTLARKVPVEKASGIRHVSRNVVLLRGPNGQLELNQFAGSTEKSVSPMPIQGPGITHVCYQAPAASDLYAKTKLAGGTIVSRGTSPIDRGYGIQYAYAKDPDGIMYELERLDKPPFTEAVWIGHVALVTPDIDRSVAFYTKLLGVKPHNRIDNIRNSPKLDDIANIDSLKLRAAWFKTGNMTLEIWQFDSPKTPVPTNPPLFTQIGYQKISFEVTNLNRAYQQLRADGISFLSAPVSSTDLATIFLRDPDGNLLSLEEFPAQTSIDQLKRPE